jgi:hypothetical protein
MLDWVYNPERKNPENATQSMLPNPRTMNSFLKLICEVPNKDPTVCLDGASLPTLVSHTP